MNTKVKIFLPEGRDVPIELRTALLSKQQFINCKKIYFVKKLPGADLIQKLGKSKIFFLT